MNILAMETTGAMASVAIINQQGKVREVSASEKMNHLQNLMPMIDTLLKECKMGINDITAIAVSEGPGSFTGIRIGISTARALSQVLEVETIGVPTLKSFAYNDPNCDGLICPIFDARRNQVYSGTYMWMNRESSGLAEIKEIIPPSAYDLKDLLDRLLLVTKGKQKEVIFFGDGVEKYHEELKQWQEASHNKNIQASFAQENIRLQNASSVARLALTMYEDGCTKEFYDLKPVYMRKAEAEIKLEASRKNKN